MTALLVTTVHGTWASDTAWAQQSSPLFVALGALTNFEIVPSNFVWSGNNNHQDRQVAAQALYDHCVRLRDRHGNVRHVIISHSHGGNVVQYGRRLTDLDQYADLFIFLGTPFLTFQKNRQVFKLFAAFRMSAVAILILGASLLFLFTAIALKNFHENRWAILVAASLLVLFLCVTIYVSANLNRQTEHVRSLVRQTVRYLAAYDEPVDDPKSRVMMHIFDEPYLYLRILILCNKMLEALYAVMHFVLRYRNGITVVLVFVLALQLSKGDVASFVTTAFGSIAVGFTVYLITGLILALAFLATSAGLRNNPLGLGRETFMTGLIYKIRLARVPLKSMGSSQTMTVKMLARPLFHSIYYRDPHCTSTISRWINEATSLKED